MSPNFKSIFITIPFEITNLLNIFYIFDFNCQYNDNLSIYLITKTNGQRKKLLNFQFDYLFRRLLFLK
jgi:hypothetical protein